MANIQLDGFLARPEMGNGRAILVLHAWWGLNETIRNFCRHLAKAGYITFAPDLYHGKVAISIAEAEKLASALDANYLQTKAEIVEAMLFLEKNAGISPSNIAVIGFSLGAYYALELATDQPDHIRSVVIFYGTGEGDFSQAKATFLGHFAAEDEYEPQANVAFLEQSLKKAGCSVTFYQYSGTGHWFFEPDRADAYNRQAADLAWERTLAFLQDSLTVGTA
jgi:carboxymethylenebutenolidase